MKSGLMVLLGIVLLPGLSLFAEEKNGLRLSVQKTTLDKVKTDLGYSDRVSKALALRTTVKNVSLKEFPAGRIQYDVIVRRWGSQDLEQFSDTVELKGLAKGESVELELGNIKIAGYESISNRREYMDRIEAWRVKVKHNDVETVSAVSGGDFERLSKSVAIQAR